MICGLMSLLASPAFAGLDLYAGTLEKFYRHDYKSVQQQLAEDLGIEFNTVYTNGEPDWLSKKSAPRKVKKFRARIEAKTDDGSPSLAGWSEDHQDYFIEQLNYDCLADLIFVTGYALRSDLERPKEFSGNYEDDPAYAESFDKEYYLGPLAIFESHMYLPSESQALIFEYDPLDIELVITSTGNLRYALDVLNDRVWEGKADPAAWLDRGPAPKGGQELRKNPKTGEIEMVDVEFEPVDDPVLHNAEYAYAVFHAALTYAETYNVPILKDG